ncbi:hypothetical protein MS6016_50370 [Klebsiella variicola]|nr:hypothetical protein MS6016_50370 [Klebsiella variicola]
MNFDSRCNNAKWALALLESGKTILMLISTSVNLGCLYISDITGDAKITRIANIQPIKTLTQKTVLIKSLVSSFCLIIAEEVPKSLNSIPKLIITKAIAIKPYSEGGMIFAR